MLLLYTGSVEILREGRVGAEMEVGKSGVEPVRGEHTVPGFPTGLFRRKIFPGVLRVPVVELVAPDPLPRPAEEPSGTSKERIDFFVDIAESFW